MTSRFLQGRARWLPARRSRRTDEHQIRNTGRRLARHPSARPYGAEKRLPKMMMAESIQCAHPHPRNQRREVARRTVRLGGVHPAGWAKVHQSGPLPLKRVIARYLKGVTRPRQCPKSRPRPGRLQRPAKRQWSRDTT
jgi:hypothetical protein